MTEQTCQQCRELTPELALGVLPGIERAWALAHLERCTTCRNTVSALTVTGDHFIELLPGAEPPAGFEDRVLSALAPTSPRTRRLWVPAAAVLLAIALAAGGWTLGRATLGAPLRVPLEAGASARTILFAPLTTGGRDVGQAYVYPGQPSWIYLSLDTDNDAVGGPVRCELIRRDGSTVQVGRFTLANGYGAWGGPADVDRGTLAAAKVIDGSGAILATARFAS